MRRIESKFVSPHAGEVAKRLGQAIRAARLARLATQESMAERARMSTLTWLKIEKGEVSVAMGSWLSALEQSGLLAHLDALSSPAIDTLGEQRRKQQLRVRAKRSDAGPDEFDF